MTQFKVITFQNNSPDIKMALHSDTLF